MTCNAHMQWPNDPWQCWVRGCPHAAANASEQRAEYVSAMSDTAAGRVSLALFLRYFPEVSSVRAREEEIALVEGAEE